MGILKFLLVKRYLILKHLQRHCLLMRKQTGESVKFNRSYSFGIKNSNHKIPDRLYKDFALTQFFHAVDFQDQPCRLFRKFSIPNNPNFLAVVSFGGVTDWRTDVLCVISPNGQLELLP